MTANEIIKALESLLDRMRAYEAQQAPIGKGLVEDIISMYDRQQAEIEKLNKARQKQAVFLGEEREQKYELIDKLSKANTEIERLKLRKCLYSGLYSEYDIKQIRDCTQGECFHRESEALVRLEAIKEFAEKVRKLWGNYDGYAFEGKFNELVKEMVGDSDE